MFPTACTNPHQGIRSSGTVDGKTQTVQGRLIPHRAIGKAHGFNAIIIAGIPVFYRYTVCAIGKVDDQIGAIVGQLQIVGDDDVALIISGSCGQA